MVTYIGKHNIPSKGLYLIFGTRLKQDLLYYNELTDLATRMPNFHYLPTLSREPWDGRTGYVHSIYQELAAGKPDAHFLLCGWKNMIDEAKNNLLAMGYDKETNSF